MNAPVLTHSASISRTPASRAFHGALLVGRGVVIESMRRKEAWVLTILMAFFALGVLVVKLAGVDSDATATMLLNLGLSFAWLSSHILALLTAGRQFPDELESRTIYPLLAKPLARRDYLLGKWLATGTIGVAAYAAFLAVVGVSWLWMPRGRELSSLLLAQTVILHLVSIYMLAALTLLGSIVLPKALNLVGVGLFFFAGAKLIGLIRAQAVGSPLEGLVRWLMAYLPDFNRLNLINRYTDGVGELTPLAFDGLALHGIILTAVCLLAASRLLARRSL